METSLSKRSRKKQEKFLSKFPSADELLQEFGLEEEEQEEQEEEPSALVNLFTDPRHSDIVKNVLLSDKMLPYEDRINLRRASASIFEGLGGWEGMEEDRFNKAKQELNHFMKILYMASYSTDYHFMEKFLIQYVDFLPRLRTILDPFFDEMIKERKKKEFQSFVRMELGKLKIPYEILLSDKISRKNIKEWINQIFLLNQKFSKDKTMSYEDYEQMQKLLKDSSHIFLPFLIKSKDKDLIQYIIHVLQYVKNELNNIKEKYEIQTIIAKEILNLINILKYLNTKQYDKMIKDIIDYSKLHKKGSWLTQFLLNKEQPSKSNLD